MRFISAKLYNLPATGCRPGNAAQTRALSEEVATGVEKMYNKIERKMIPGGTPLSTQQYVLPQSEAGPNLENVRLLYVTCAQYSAEWASAPHIHTCAELFFVTGGSGSMQIQQELLPAATGDMIFINAGVPHTERSQTEDPMEYVVLGVEGMETHSDPGGYGIIHGFAGLRQVSACLDILLQEVSSGQTVDGAMCQYLVRVLLLLLIRQQQSVLLPVSSIPKASRECAMVRRYIDHRFKENITLDQLAAAAHLNKFYLSHSFQREYGVSPIRYLMLRRIQESRFLLSETDHSLSHIAQVLGFSSPSYFSQCFRRIEGVSPKEYRLNCRNEK